MILRFMNAVLLGMLAGIVLFEGLLAVLGWLQPGQDPVTALTQGSPPLPAIASLLLCCSSGACCSTLLAANLARSHAAAALCAGLWLLPMLLLIGLSPSAFSMLISASAISLLAWLLARRFIKIETSES